MAFAHDGQAGMYVTLIPGDPSNVEFTLQGAEGLIVHAKDQKNIGFASVQCPSLNLRQGSNLVAFGCPVENYSVFQVLTELGSTNASSIQRYNPGAGAFETVAFDLDNQLVGVDFPVVPGEGYFVYMK